ncbi:MAG TPA: hypothetical protein VK593_06145 [Edaphobacter sp.]|nr:hypothetical protein [Edaphobacter sp.]
MKKRLSLVSLAVMSMALQAQTSASPQAPDPAMTPGSTQTGSQPGAATDTSTPQASQQAAQVQVQAASVSAELTKSIDTKKAKVGDAVNAKTTSPAKLPDGTDLPKGTKLVGNVVEVTPKSKDQKNSHLVLALNRAVMKDGQEMPIRSAVTSMTASAGGAGGAMAMSPGSSAGSGGGGGGGSAAGAGAGGGGGSAGGGASSSPAPSAPMMSDSGSQAQPAVGAMLKNAQDRVAVGNMPNVMLSAPTTPESAGVLDAAGQNISLDSGTKLTLNLIPARPGAQRQ